MHRTHLKGCPVVALVVGGVCWGRRSLGGVCVCVCVCVYGPQAAVLSRPLQSLTDAPGGAGALQYAVTFHGAYNVLPGVRELKVQLKRANKAAYTVVRPVQQGEVVWEEMVPLTTSLYADIKTGQ